MLDNMRFLPLILLPAALAAQPAVSLEVAAVRFRSSFDLADNTGRMIAALQKLAAAGVRVAVFPECALTGYRTETLPPATAGQIAAAEDRIRATCRERRIAAVFGSIHHVNGHAYDAAVAVDSRGELIERYGKLMLAGEKWAVPGNHIAFFELEGVPSTVIVCHDERYPEFVRLPALAGARILYYVSAESSLLAESKLEPYRAQMMARAVENRMFVVAANAPTDARDLAHSSHGQSRIIADDGNVLEQAGFFGEDMLVRTLEIRPSRLDRPLGGITGDWWRQGVGAMLRNRGRRLD